MIHSSSFIRSGVFLLCAGIAILAVMVLTKDSSATSYNPTMDAALANPAPGANSNISVDFDIPSPDSNFTVVVSLTPPGFGIVECTAQTASPSCADDVIPDGTMAGELDSVAHLGILNGGCNTQLEVHFDLMDATTDMSSTTVFQDTDANDTGEQFEDDDTDSIPNGAEMYPDYLSRLVRSAPFPAGSPAQPIQRLYGQTDVATNDVGINFLIFAPGTSINGIEFDPALGFPSVSILNNTGDPEGVFEPTTISDFCTPLQVTTTSYGMAGSTPHRTNPDEDTAVTFAILTRSQPDADNDGIENALDPCTFDANSEWDPRVTTPSGDTEADGLPNPCDPDDSVLTGNNSDQDGDEWFNRGDNCPLVSNSDQLDTDIDGIGNACDPNSSEVTGHQHDVCLFAEVDVGTGGTAPDLSEVPPCGDSPSTATPVNSATPTQPSTVTPTPGPGTQTPGPGTVTPTPGPGTQTPGPGTASPTPGPGTVTPTPGGPTPTPAPTNAPGQETWGDGDCDDEISTRDNQALLRKVLSQAALSQTEPCPDFGDDVGDHIWGDWDCDDEISTRDNQALLRKVLSQGALSQTEPCTDIGDPEDIS